MDRLQIGLVLVNLIRNAVEAMDQTQPQKRALTITSRAVGEEIEVAVKDSGTGVAANMQQRLFLPFQTSKPHGLGLGLALSRCIIKAHGGRLWAQANEEGGTTFFFTLQP